MNFLHIHLYIKGVKLFPSSFQGVNLNSLWQYYIEIRNLSPRKLSCLSKDTKQIHWSIEMIIRCPELQHYWSVLLHLTVGILTSYVPWAWKEAGKLVVFHKNEQMLVGICFCSFWQEPGGFFFFPLIPFSLCGKHHRQSPTQLFSNNHS